MSRDLANGNGEQRPLLGDATPSYDSTPSGATTPTTKPLNDPSRTQFLLILVALWSAVFLGALDTTIVATLLGSIGSHFDRAHQSSYLGSAYLLSFDAIAAISVNHSHNRQKRRNAARAIVVCGTLLCGLAPSMETLIAARAIAGMGGGGIMTVSSVTVTDLIPLKRRGIYQGLANVLFGLGAGLGGPLGGFINDRFGWRWAFLIQAPILATSFLLVLFFVDIKLPAQAQTTREKLARIDYLGSLTLVLGVGCSLLAVTLKGSEELPWNSPLILGLLFLGLTSCCAFVGVEGFVSKHPIMPLRLLKQRTPLAVALVNFCTSVVAFSALYNVPLWYQTVRLENAETAGLHLLPNAVALAAGSLASGFYMRFTGTFYYFILACSLLIVLSNAMLASWTESSSTLHLWGDIVPTGFGNSAVITSTLIAIIASVDREDLAVATGVTYLFRTTGQVIGVSLSGALLQSLLVKNLRERITGPGAADTIQSIRRSITIIPHLDPQTRRAAIESYANSLRAVYFAQMCFAIISFLCCLPIEENPLPGTMAEQAEQEDRRRRERQQSRSGDEA
ncbi:hypothetical protein FRB97_009610 [Tulasnella sp. 331]|nr:hypothetical protein FRB97_009610 [Tulasnella sp. 331]